MPLRTPALLFYSLLTLSLWGQSNPPDTVFVKRTVEENVFEVDTLFIPGGLSTPQVLAGTTFLPYSEKMIGLLNNGLSPISLEILETCDNSTARSNKADYPIFKNITRTDNQLTIDVVIIANCCHNFLGEAEVVDDNTLNLLYTAYGGFCSCSCCYTLRYKFDTTMEKHYQVLKYVTINGSEEKKANF